MKGWKRKGAGKEGFSLLEMLVVLGIMAMLAGVGAGGSNGIRQWLAVNESRTLFMEIENACRLYRMESGEWPAAMLGGEVDLNGGISEWRRQLAPFMERQVTDRVIEDGFGNTRIFLILDEDGDHWIGRQSFEALDPATVPPRIWTKVALYSLDEEGGIAVKNWSDGEP